MKICQGKKYLYLIVLKKQTGVIVLFINFFFKKNIWELWLCLVFQVWSVYLLDMYYSHLVWRAATFQPGNLHVWSRTVPIALSKCILRDHLEVCWCVNVSELWSKALMCVHKFSAPPSLFSFQAHFKLHSCTHGRSLTSQNTSFQRYTRVHLHYIFFHSHFTVCALSIWCWVTSIGLEMHQKAENALNVLCPLNAQEEEKKKAIFVTFHWHPIKTSFQFSKNFIFQEPFGHKTCIICCAPHDSRGGNLSNSVTPFSITSDRPGIHSVWCPPLV